MDKTKKDEKGFTLIEVLVSMVIISVVTAALAGLLFTTIDTNKASEAKMGSAAVAQNILNRFAAQVSTGGGVPASCANVAASCNQEYIVGESKVLFDLYTTATATPTGFGQEVVLRVVIHHESANGRTYESQMVVWIRYDNTHE